MRKKILFLFFLFVYFLGNAQEKQIDSLKSVIAKAADDSNKVEHLNSLSKLYLSSDLNEAIKIAVQARDLAEKIDFKKGQAYALKNIGLAYNTQAKYVEALQQWLESLKLFEEINFKPGVANMMNNLGVIYANQGDDARAVEFYLKSLKPSEELKDTLRIATALINIGVIYQNKKATRDKALEYFLRALPLSIATDDQDVIGTTTVNLGEIYFDKGGDSTALVYFEKSRKAYEGSENLPYTLNNIGKVYEKNKNFSDAIRYHQMAYDMAKKLDAKNDMAISLLGIAKTYIAKGEANSALEAYREAELLAEEIGAKYQLKDAYQGLSDTYSLLGDFKNAFKYQQLLTTIKDTIYNIDTDKKLGSLMFNFEIEKKQSQITMLTKDKEIQQQEIKRQKIVRNGFIGGFAIVLLFAVIFLSQRNRISKEKKRSDELLLNILPEETAEELKETGKAKVKSFDMITVMFTDFKNFTLAAEKLTPEELVSEINYCYSEFDKIITKHGIEKIKTIGDSYMCAGGVPVSNNTHPFDVINAGLDMQDFIEKNKHDRIAKGLPYFELRLGIHTGPVVAGIVGIKKFAYDIWGDAVNLASRMESSGEVGRVNISEATYNLVKDSFNCIYRGKVYAKNKGEIDMYFVERKQADQKA